LLGAGRCAPAARLGLSCGCWVRLLPLRSRA
jgi:hypothetical protein